MTEQRIIKGVGGLYTVKTQTGNINCRARGIFRNKNIIPLVGDKVETENGVITKILPRKNFLIRPPCANIDKMFLVVAMNNPLPNLYMLDKMLAIAYYHKIKPILIFNKADLKDELNTEAIYRNLPIEQYVLSATDDKFNVAEKLRKQIKNNTVVMSGLSGVGKSSLMNLLDKNLALKTGNVSEKLLRGKHTTRHVELFELAGGHILDTPGFSNLLFEYFDIKDRSILAECFPEFSAIEGSCRFTDCTHTKEPGCRIINALKEGKIQKSRHENYCRMYEEIGPKEEWKDK